MFSTPTIPAVRRIRITPAVGPCELCDKWSFDADRESTVQTVTFSIPRWQMVDDERRVNLCAPCMQSLEDAAYIAVRTVRARGE